MSRDEVIKVLSILKTSYPRFYQGLSKHDAENTINLWSVMFKADDAKSVTIALYKLIATNEFPPSISEMRKALSDITLGQTPDAGEAWGEVTRAMRNYGWMRGEEAIKSMSPLTATVVKRLGWMTLCQSEELMADRAHFMKIYAAAESRVSEKNMIPTLIQKEIELSIENTKQRALTADSGSLESIANVLEVQCEQGNTYGAIDKRAGG